MTFHQRDLDDRFPVISGTCHFCQECAGETRLFMGSVVHVPCLRKAMNRASWGYNPHLKQRRATA